LDLSSAAVVDFPLRGEWRAINTPAERVPSHGTDYFGQRYAYDFSRLDGEGTRFQPGSILRQLTLGVRASQFYCWDQPIHASFAGRVVAVGDDWPDRRHVSALWELARTSFTAPEPKGPDYRPLAGNFVMIEAAQGVALYAHLRRGSTRVREGQTVAAGELIGAVGNSGNSTMPHLHFHLMDGVDPLIASGLPCAFRRYERFVKDAWVLVDGGAPSRLERIRSA
jgi:hypothetical protein